MSIIPLVKFIIINFICIILNCVAILIGTAIVSFLFSFFLYTEMELVLYVDIVV